MKYVYIVYKEENLSVFESQVLKFLNLLIKKGMDVLLVVVKNKSTDLKDLENNIEKYIDKRYVILSDISPVFYWKWRRIISDNDIIKKIISKKNRTIVHCRSAKATILGSEMKKKYDNIKVIFDNRGVPVEEIKIMIESEKNLKSKMKLYLSSIFFKICLNVASKASDGYIFVTRNLREYMNDKYNFNNNKPSLIIPTSILLEEEKETLNKDVNKFIYVGSSDCWQNVDEIIKLFKEIEEKNDLSKFMILSKDKNSFSKINKKIGVNNLTIKSAKHDEVINELRSSSFGILLRNDSIVNKVSSPTKVIEYLTMKLKVIYNGEVGVIEDLKANYGNEVEKYLIKVDELENYLLNNEDVSCDNSFIEYFSWDKNVNKIINFIERI